MGTVNEASTEVESRASAEVIPLTDTPEPAPYFARTAICFMRVDDEGDDDALYQRLTRALKDDPRVETIDAPDQNEHSLSRPILSSFGSFASDDSVDLDEAPDPFSHLHAFSFRNPIVLQVRSPRRLQQNYQSFNYIPADRYWAAWDGLTLVVLWELEDRGDSRESELTSQDLRRATSPSAGLLVQDILKDAVDKCDEQFRTVPCSPNCNYPFSHADLVVKTIGESENTLFHDPTAGYKVGVDLAADHSPIEAVEALHRSLAFASKTFARMRSDGQTMEAASWQAHSDVSRLLEINYEQAVIGTRPFFKSLRERWNARGWRREERRLVARISLELATIEHVRGGWSRSKKLYDDSAQKGNVGVTFSHEYELSLNAVSSLELAEAHAAIDRVTGSLDMRSLILVTAVASIIGAIVGALAASLF
jgi:hypothetical protein